jgi:hypothetical protein
LTLSSPPPIPISLVSDNPRRRARYLDRALRLPVLHRLFIPPAARAAASICRRAPQVWAKKGAKTSGMAHSAQAANWIPCPCPANRAGCTASRPRQRRASNPAATSYGAKYILCCRPCRMLGISTQLHQAFFDAVASADQKDPFSALPRAQAMARIAQIGWSQDSIQNTVVPRSSPLVSDGKSRSIG